MQQSQLAGPLILQALLYNLENVRLIPWPLQQPFSQGSSLPVRIHFFV